MAKRKKAAVRGAGQGRVKELASGRFNAVASAGKDSGTGKRVRVQATFGTRAEAEAWLASRAEAGSHASEWTVGRWLDHWLDTCRLSLQPATFSDYRRQVSQLIRPHLGPLRLRSLGRVAVDRWRAKLVTDKLTTRYRAHRAAATLSTSLRAAVEAGAVPRNPVGRLRKVSAPAKAFSVWTADQCRAFLRFTEKAPSAPVWRIMLDTGMRPSELLALTWADLDLDAGAVTVSKAVTEEEGVGVVLKPPKSALGHRTVLLHPSTVVAWAGRKGRLPPARTRPGSHVFTRHQFPDQLMAVGGLYEAHWRHLLRAAVAAGAVPHIRLYDLRHTSATLLLAAGVSLKVVADRLGHEPEMTLKHYARFLPGQQDAARVAAGGFL